MAAFRTSAMTATVAAPNISSVSPTSGSAGTSVAITGTNFGASQGTSMVTFNGMAAPPTSWSDSSITVPVPSGATSGNLIVSVAGQASNAASFTVTANTASVSVSVSPSTTSVQVSQSALFTASVQNDTLNKGVTWSLSGSGCSGSSCGTLTNTAATSVTYVAPSSAPSPASVTLTATSVADGTKNAASSIAVAQPPPASASGTPTFALNHVSSSNTQGNQVDRYVLRLPNITQSGNCVIVGFQYGFTPGVTASVTDDQGDAYSPPISNSDGNQIVNISYAVNVAAGAQKITITFSGGTPPYVSALASEFYNVATANALDGSSGNSGTGSVVSSGSFAPANSGDLIYQFAVQDSTTNPMISWTQGSSPWTLLSADVMDGSVAQYQVQTSAASINPTLNMAPAQNFNSVAVALKSASAGSAPPLGIRVVRVQHNSIPPYPSNPIPLQFPCTGNLIVVAWIGEAGNDITAITDGKESGFR